MKYVLLLTVLLVVGCADNKSEEVYSPLGKVHSIVESGDGCIMSIKVPVINTKDTTYLNYEVPCSGPFHLGQPVLLMPLRK